MGLQPTPDGLHDPVRWTSIPAHVDTVYHIARVNEYVQQLCSRLLDLKSSPSQIDALSRRELGLLEGRV